MKKKETQKTDSGFTANEVGTMLESINTQIKAVAEGHSGLDKRLERVEVEVHGNSRRLDMLELSFRILNDKTSHVENAVSKLNKDVTGLKGDVAGLKGDVAGLKGDVAGIKTDLAATKKELKADIRELGNRLTTVETRP